MGSSQSSLEAPPSSPLQQQQQPLQQQQEEVVIAPVPLPSPSPSPPTQTKRIESILAPQPLSSAAIVLAPESTVIRRRRGAAVEIDMQRDDLTLVDQPLHGLKEHESDLESGGRFIAASEAAAAADDESSEEAKAGSDSEPEPEITTSDGVPELLRSIFQRRWALEPEDVRRRYFVISTPPSSASVSSVPNDVVIEFTSPPRDATAAASLVVKTNDGEDVEYGDNIFVRRNSRIHVLFNESRLAAVAQTRALIDCDRSSGLVEQKLSCIKADSADREENYVKIPVWFYWHVLQSRARVESVREAFDEFIASIEFRFDTLTKEQLVIEIRRISMLIQNWDN